MFTGIILAIGNIAAIEKRGGDVRLKVNTGTLNLKDAQLGDSIAVNGVCLTAVELGEHYFCADVSNETLSRTILNHATINTPVNLELALMPSSRMGGHIVSGHVDGIGKVINKKNDGRSIRFEIKAPDELAKYIAQKGSICINGISLTVNSIHGAVFDINIVPHTLKETTLGTTDIGAQVNLEVDLLARYLERLMLGNQSIKASGTITEDFLNKTGFMSSNKTV